MLQICNINNKRRQVFTFMKFSKKVQIIVPVFLALFFFVSLAYAAAPDGLGPAADTVVSSSQGLMKNGSPVAALRSDPTAALGVPENDTVEGHFYSLGFGGNLVLGLDNGIINGAIIIESTELFYPGEKANIEMSDDGTTWVMAGTVTQDGTVNKPDGLVCARFIRITDVSDPAAFSDDTADGYDVDGVQSTGDPCTITPTPTQAPTATPTPAPTSVPSTNTTTNVTNNTTNNTTNTTTTTSSPTSTPTPTPVFVGTVGTSSPCIPSGNPLVPCFPNTGSLAPRLPNTGIGPDNRVLRWIFPAAALVSLALFYLIQGKRKFSSK
jgi:hypothetical protein